jgi:hypothetical protein
MHLAKHDPRPLFAHLMTSNPRRRLLRWESSTHRDEVAYITGKDCAERCLQCQQMGHGALNLNRSLSLTSSTPAGFKKRMVFIHSNTFLKHVCWRLVYFILQIINKCAYTKKPSYVFSGYKQVEQSIFRSETTHTNRSSFPGPMSECAEVEPRYVMFAVQQWNVTGWSRNSALTAERQLSLPGSRQNCMIHRNNFYSTDFRNWNSYRIRAIH